VSKRFSTDFTSTTSVKKMQRPHEYIQRHCAKNRTVFHHLAPFIAEVEISWDNVVKLLKADYLGQCVCAKSQQCVNQKLVKVVKHVFQKWSKDIEPPVCIDINGFVDFDITFLHHPEFEYEGNFFRKKGSSIKYFIDGYIRMFEVIPNHKQLMLRECNGKKLGFFI
jgi:hypothetical protein